MTKQKRGLGKGLSALIPDSIDTIDDIKGDKDIVLNVEINEIKPKKDQPRAYFEKDSLRELEDSILQHGIVQPILVRKIDIGYEIVAGERRWRACKNASIKEIPCIVKDMDDRKVMEISLIENLQREDLNEIEEGEAFKRLINDFDITQEELGNIVGKSRTYITNTMRLLKLGDRVKQMIIEKVLSGGHGRALLRLKDLETQWMMASKVVEEKLSVREVERLVAEIIEEKEKKKPRKRSKSKDSSILYIENSLKDRFSTKVNIVKGKKKGRIEIEYYSDDDLQRIVEILNTN